jgi:hypothetical protein
MLFFCFALFAVPTNASNATGSRQTDTPDEPVYSELPGIEDPLVRELWSEGIGLEKAGDFLAANVRYQNIADRLETSAYPYWRMSRNLLLHSTTLPKEEKDEQIRLLEMADHTAKLGIEIDDECAECVFWRYRALGRLPTVRGLLSAAADANTMAKLLNRGIELGIAKGEDPSNTTLANFYYASATFYRMVPDWFWIRWVFGVRGNKERALSDARKAVALHESRAEFQIELGASLLCLGSESSGSKEKRSALTAEGFGLLRRVQDAAPLNASESPDRELAQMLMQSPENACEFSRDGFLDVKSVAASQQ